MKAGDKVVVLDKGASVEEGRFEKLRWKRGGVDEVGLVVVRWARLGRGWKLHRADIGRGMGLKVLVIVGICIYFALFIPFSELLWGGRTL